MSDRPSPSPRPTDAELAILAVLWRRGPCTVRQVHEAVRPGGKAVYTTTLKLMQVMASKGLVDRDLTSRSHVYRARLSEERAQKRLVGGLIKRAFGGSLSKLVMRALSVKRASPSELAEIRRLLKQSKREHDDAQ